ncbi:HEPN domain-containing protein [Clostridiaceae bacterium M8S5]|nr:HEPN domain-containing protein [Clostridiaceae bacterium M8S5]
MYSYSADKRKIAKKYQEEMDVYYLHGRICIPFESLMKYSKLEEHEIEDIVIKVVNKNIFGNIRYYNEKNNELLIPKSSEFITEFKELNSNNKNTYQLMVHWLIVYRIMKNTSNENKFLEFIQQFKNELNLENIYHAELIGIIEGVDKSICKLKTDNYDFKFKVLSEDDYRFFKIGFNIDDNLIYHNIPQDCFIDYVNNGERDSAITLNMLWSDKKSEIEGERNIWQNQDLVLKPRINQIYDFAKLIRLITTNSIWITQIYKGINTGNAGCRNIIKESEIQDKEDKLNKITDKEVLHINNLIDEIEYPFKDEKLKLAMNYYDLSFFVPEQQVRIILLITCLEIIYHPGDSNELKYRVARNTAVFLGNNDKESKDLFIKVKAMYDLRSKLVHSGKYGKLKDIKNVLELQDVTDKSEVIKHVIKHLREIVSKSIINYYFSFVKNKKGTFFGILDQKGFGSNPFNVESIDFRSEPIGK